MSILVIASLAKAGLASLAAGFAVPLSPPGASHHRGLVALDDNVPPLLARQLDVDQDGLVPRMDTIAVWGRVRVRIGASLWLPARMVTRHRVGRDFASDIGVTSYGRTVLNVIDADVRGRGIAGPASRPDVGAEIVQRANLFLRSEGVLIPSVFAAGTRLKAVEDDSTTIRLDLPYAAATESAWLYSDDGRAEFPTPPFVTAHSGRVERFRCADARPAAGPAPRPQWGEWFRSR